MSDHAQHNEQSAARPTKIKQSLLTTRKTTTKTNSGEEQRHTIARRQTFQVPITEPVRSASLVCGLLAGVAQAGLFNPYDRALYLSVTNHRPFLHVSNWQSPYSGFLQSLGGRALAGGLYFPVEHFCLRCVKEGRPETEFLGRRTLRVSQCLCVESIFRRQVQNMGTRRKSGRVGRSDRHAAQIGWACTALFQWTIADSRP